LLNATVQRARQSSVILEDRSWGATPAVSSTLPGEEERRQLLLEGHNANRDLEKSFQRVRIPSTAKRVYDVGKGNLGGGE
jgi:hypothetical protein